MLLAALHLTARAQQSAFMQGPWVPDLGNGRYKNPVLYADYSDPDVCRKGSRYYLVSSSFDAVPGLPILQSRDLVNWRIIGHALLCQPPYSHYARSRHGGGVWAPSIRIHRDSFFIYYADPDYGIYMVKAGRPQGPWSEPLLVEAGKGLEDPCPLWDSDGNVYLVHAFAGSRAGMRSILVMHRLNRWGTSLAAPDNGVLVYDGHRLDPDVEGPKLYKKDGYYYIFAPAGGFEKGWQIVLRSRHVYGPYARRVVMAQQHSDIATPHQGAWVQTPQGQSWFVHFAKPTPYGRLVYLEPMHWHRGWPVIGLDKTGSGIGAPVDSFFKPETALRGPIRVPQTSDEFNSPRLGLQWQWQANPRRGWAFPSAAGYLRLYAQLQDSSESTFWDFPGILMQKFPAPAFQATAKLTFHGLHTGDKTGLIVLGKNYAYLAISKGLHGLELQYGSCLKADQGGAEQVQNLQTLPDSTLYFRVDVAPGAQCRFSYSTDGRNFHEVPGYFQAVEGKWIGAKLGLFCRCRRYTNDRGYADFDWFRVRGPGRGPAPR